MLHYFLFIIVGIVSGMLAGLMGIGGGSVLVPTFMLSLDIPKEYINHVAIATSTCVILFTSVFSSISHFKHNAIKMNILMLMTIGVIFGSFITGNFIFTRLSGKLVNIVFIIFVLMIALQTIFKINPSAEYDVDKKIPKFLFISAGFVIAGISSVIGVGGGFLTVPLLIYLGLPIHNAIATSAGLGLPIALTSTLVYSQQTIPVEDTIGLIYWPVVLIIFPITSITAVIGAKISHKLDTKKLKTTYAYFLITLCIALSLRLVLSN
jgi:uncharacterized membrane protein YfcA